MGVTAEQLEDAMDEDEAKDAVIELILAMRTSTDDQLSGGTAADEQRLLNELQGMRQRYLRKRAKEIGVSGDRLEHAMDTDEPEAAAIELITYGTDEIGGCGQATLWISTEGSTVSTAASTAVTVTAGRGCQARHAQLPVGPPSPSHTRLRYADQARRQLLDGYPQRHGR